MRKIFSFPIFGCKCECEKEGRGGDCFTQKVRARHNRREKHQSGQIRSGLSNTILDINIFDKSKWH